ncbi:unnamed protein product [Lactuca saligna]|uniref:Uncharacterized protein n=1 Tax=Lactuca saligna TaxID=75948 RepID=A0AA36EGV4_LACSI|nr:unnamed protein product [Lactuca saligna]
MSQHPPTPPINPSSNSSEQQENEAAVATVDCHYIPPPLQSTTIALLPLSPHRIPAYGTVGGDRWWWGLPTTTTTTSSGSTTAPLLLSSQYNGGKRGTKEKGLGKRDRVRLEWFYGGRRCSSSRWSFVVEWRLAGGAVAISILPEVAAPFLFIEIGNKRKKWAMVVMV